MKWVALFSQTGSEILNVSNLLEINPYKIITNQQDITKINQTLLNKYKKQILTVDKKPSLSMYYNMLDDADLITLHGWLRIIPGEICNKYEIYNLHPGLITKYPELKGFNPQEKAYKLKLPTSGCVIHKVTPEVDSGEILASSEVSIKNLKLEDVYKILHNNASKLWYMFLNQKIRG